MIEIFPISDGQSLDNFTQGRHLSSIGWPLRPPPHAALKTTVWILTFVKKGFKVLQFHKVRLAKDPD